jgi:phosphate transport system protein
MERMHTSREYEADLRELRAMAVAMGERCERALGLALEAFWSGSPEAAKKVESLDREIDDDEIRIDAHVLRILALRQPVAHDLRILMTALKLVTDLERIGDEATNIADRATQGHALAHDNVGALLKKMSEEAKRMVRDALQAFVDGEVLEAQDVMERDDVVDAAYGQVLDAMSAFMREEPTKIPSAIRVIQIAKSIERVADHATNIAEEVIFMVRGDDVRHVKSRPPR